MLLIEYGIFLASRGPTKSITRFDRLDCGPSSSSFADAAGGGGATRNLIFIPTCVSACEGDAEDAKDAELKASCLFLALLHEGGRGNRPATRGRLRARGRSITLPAFEILGGISAILPTLARRSARSARALVHGSHSDPEIAVASSSCSCRPPLCRYRFSQKCVSSTY